MEQMTKRIITACHLDAGAVDEYGTDEYQIDESIRNLQDLDGIYADYVKGCGDPQLVTDFQREFLHWNGGDEVTDPVQKFLGEDYKSKMAILKAAIKPLLTALDQTHMQLAVDHRCEYWLTAIPCGDLPEGMDTGKLLDATISLGDAQHLVAVID